MVYHNPWGSRFDEIKDQGKLIIVDAFPPERKSQRMQGLDV
jgi:hypothetical protein